MSNEDEQIADDVLPPMVEQIAVPAELNKVFPWHRPRKQFVRREQWVKWSDILIKKVRGTPALPTQLDGRHEVKYLTLPGLDYLDVEMIAQKAQENNCVLTSIGFLESSVGFAELARAELRQESLIQAGAISDRSHTFNRRIQEITKKSSPAYRELKNKGPFHVINLDACGSMALPSADEDNRMINVIHTLLEYQFANYSGSWLLFITTDVRKESFAQKTIDALFRAIKLNTQQSDEFKKASLEFLGNPNSNIEAALLQYHKGEGDNFMKSFALGFGKWLLTLAHDQGWNMIMHSSYCYSTTPDNDPRASMPCMAFEFVPPNKPLTDPVGVVTTQAGKTDNYTKQSMRVLEKVKEISNLDVRLNGDTALKQELLIETKYYLERIGYSPASLEQLS